MELINHVSYVKLYFSLPLEVLLGTCRLEHIKQAWRRGFGKKCQKLW